VDQIDRNALLNLGTSKRPLACFELVDELIELVEIDAGPESEGDDVKTSLTTG
jgi:hypothetical protein